MLGLANMKGRILKALKILKKDGLRILLCKIWYHIIILIKYLTIRLITKPYLMLNKKNVLNYLIQFSSTDSEEIFNFISNKFLKAFKPMQVKEEFVALLDTLKEINPQVIMEIGTANGGTLFSFCKLAKGDATIISLDLPKGSFGGGYIEWRIPFYKAFARGEQKLHLLRKDSHKQDTLEEIKKILNGNQLDFLFIDGDHSYEGVKKDFEMYSPFVKKGGIIAFHDIAPDGLPEFTGGVPKFWKEIKNKYNSYEYIENINQEGYGIGVLFL
jgi:predicted O-methyltransferase YrrM